MKTAPQKIGSAEVILFSVIDNRHLPTGNCRHAVSGITQGPASGLAICRYPGESGFYLLGCDSDWNSITDTFHETLEKAKAQAEFEYQGVSTTWELVNNADQSN
jgi:hypothetical protein